MLIFATPLEDLISPHSRLASMDLSLPSSSLVYEIFRLHMFSGPRLSLSLSLGFSMDDGTIYAVIETHDRWWKKIYNSEFSKI